jgi:hypothetical protein
MSTGSQSLGFKAGNPASLKFSQRWSLRTALIGCLRAAGGKNATLWRVQRGWKFAFEDDALGR